MKTRRIGSLEVTIVGLGCNNFGRRLDEAATARVVHAALDAGVTFFDTADMYGGTNSEVFLGRALRPHRDRAIVATKFGWEIDAERRGARPEYVRRAVDDSLRRLGMDRIDLYQLHKPDPAVPIADTLGALDALVRAGKVREIGCSNFSVPQLIEADDVARRTGGARFVSVQNEYSMLKREPEKGVLDTCERLGLAFLPYFPLASGLLSGKYRRSQPLPTGARITQMPGDETLTVIERLVAFAEKHRHSLLDLAFAWLLAKPAIASVIAGATKAEQVAANVRAGEWRLSPQELEEVDALLGEATPA
jgi:aryl-alcohol dehydrogenase-like predicted oxidoreductase